MEIRYGPKINPTVVELSRFEVRETPVYSESGELLYTTVTIEGVGKIKEAE
jgi:hypothetical protein